MQSPYKKITVFDLETGGFSEHYNPITEIAIVTIDLEHLEIEDEWSVMIQPRFDLTEMMDDSLKEAKKLFKSLATKDPDALKKMLSYKGKELMDNELGAIEEDIDKLKERLGKERIIDYDLYLKLQATDLRDIGNLYFDFCYHPQALSITHIKKEDLINEGIPYEEAFKLIKDKFMEMKVGNSKPILSGHNIKKFDMRFMQKLFKDNNFTFEDFINSTQLIDTLEWARLRWFELPSYSLGNCANKVGLTLKEAHRALPDTVANAQFLIKLLENLRGEGLEEKEYKRRKFTFNF